MTEPASRFSSDHQTIWQQIIEKLKEELPRQSYLTWFKPIEPLSFSDKKLTLRVPNQFCYDWIESHYGKQLQRAITETFDEGIELAYKIASKQSSGLSGEELNATRARREANLPVIASKINNNAHLNQRYRFSNFIEGDCNRFARAAAMSLAEAPGRTPFNPLLIYGGSGLGKTHLMQAIGNHVTEYGFARKVLYVTSEQFTSDFVKGIQQNQKESFSRIYRHVDVLLLDDVQFFMAKEKTQEEFFHTFNALHHSGKQLVFSSDRSPRDLEGLDERLISRLQWGLVTELRKPDFETRLAIVKNLADEDSVVLADDVAQFITTHITDNIRTLQSALIHMLAQASLIGRLITLELARDVVRNLLQQPVRSMSVEHIQETVAKELNIPGDLLRSKTRKREVTQARQIAMFLTVEYTKLTLKAIGLHFGGRDHATVIHARGVVSKAIKSDSSVSELIDKLRQKLELASL